MGGRKPLKPGVAPSSLQSPRDACGQGEPLFCWIELQRENGFLGLSVCAEQRKAGQVPDVQDSLSRVGFTAPRTLASVLSLAGDGGLGHRQVSFKPSFNLVST